MAGVVHVAGGAGAPARPGLRQHATKVAAVEAILRASGVFSVWDM